MRIGNIDDINKSQEAGNLAALIQTDSSKTMTKAEKRKNWWNYNKWYVVCGIMILLIVCNVIGNTLGIFDKSPDFQIAYVGDVELPQDTISALEEAFASIASDFNGDGEVIVKINQYTNGSENSVPDTAYYAYASEIALIGDIEDCDSYFFLMEDPEHIQKEYQVLAAFDGSCPDETDYTIEDKVIRWTDSALLSGMELGSYSTDFLGQTTTGDNQELLSSLFIGRRCFYSDVMTDNAEACADLWNTIIRATKEEADLVLSAESKSEVSEEVTIGSHLKIQNIDNRLTLLSNLDVLSADGLYYASWVIGNAQSYENSDGDTVDLYDASLYLLLGEYNNTQAAQDNMDTWLATANKNYDVLNREEITCNGQTYTLITYSTHEDNPYARGESVFGVYESCAICIELTCQEQFTENLNNILTDFLNDCTYTR